MRILANRLIKRGNSVKIIAPMASILGESEGIKLSDISSNVKIPSFTTHPLMKGKTFLALNDDELYTFIVGLKKTLKIAEREGKPEFAHAFHLIGWPNAFMGVYPNVPLIITICGNEIETISGQKRYLNMAREAAEHAVELYSVSGFVKEKIVELLDIPRRKIKVVYDGVDTRFFRKRNKDKLREKWKIPKDAYVIVTACKLAPQKGLSRLIWAAKYYEILNPNIYTFIAGDGIEMPLLKEIARTLGVRKVRFLGYVEREVIAELYNIADLYILPSIWEPLGISALEAMACEVPVLVSRVGGFPEIVAEGVNGWFIRSPDDPIDFAQQVIELLDREKLKKAGIAGRRMVERKFAKDKLLRRYCRYYRKHGIPC